MKRAPISVLSLYNKYSFHIQNNILQSDTSSVPLDKK